MKAKTAQIYVDGKLILNATNLSYDGKKLQLTGLLLHGTVESVRIPLPGADANAAVLAQPDSVKKLEIRLSLL